MDRLKLPKGPRLTWLSSLTRGQPPRAEGGAAESPLSPRTLATRSLGTQLRRDRQSGGSGLKEITVDRLAVTLPIVSFKHWDRLPATERDTFPLFWLPGGPSSHFWAMDKEGLPFLTQGACFLPSQHLSRRTPAPRILDQEKVTSRQKASPSPGHFPMDAPPAPAANTAFFWGPSRCPPLPGFPRNPWPYRHPISSHSTQGGPRSLLRALPISGWMSELNLPKADSPRNEDWGLRDAGWASVYVTEGGGA